MPLHMPQGRAQVRPNGDSAAVDHGAEPSQQVGPRAVAISFRAPRPATSYLPQVLVATALVAVLPVAVVWELRVQGVISSPWVGIPLAIGLSLLASLLGSAYWKRRRGSGDLLFSELLLWGWLRRLYADHQVSQAAKQLGLTASGDLTHGFDGSPEQRTRLLRQLAAGLNEQDAYTKGHSRRVARHATMIAHKLHLSREQVAKIQTAAIVHDLGKLRVPKAVLYKPAKLTAAEFQIVKRHPEAGAAMVAGLGDDELTSIVRHHHERVDGSGYPDGLRGDQIPLGARIVAVVDMFDAITEPRPYRPAAPHRQAFDTLTKEAGTHLDADVVRAFRSCYSGRGPLAWWAALATALAWIVSPRAGSAGRPGVSSRQVISTTAVTAAVAAVAVAAPITAHRLAEHHKAPAAGTGATAGRSSSHPRSARAPTQRRLGGRSRRTSGAVGVRVAPAVVARVARPSSPPAPAPRLSGGSSVGSVRPNAPAAKPTHPPASTPTHPPASTPTHPPASTPTNPPTRKPTSHPPTRKPTSHPPATTPNAPTTSTPSPPPATTVTSPTTPSTGPTGTSTTSAPPTTTTTAPPTVMPVSKAQCMGGGYAQYGFKNQGQCIAFVENGG